MIAHLLTPHARWRGLRPCTADYWPFHQLHIRPAPHSRQDRHQHRTRRNRHGHRAERRRQDNADPGDARLAQAHFGKRGAACRHPHRLFASTDAVRFRSAAPGRPPDDIDAKVERGSRRCGAEGNRCQISPQSAGPNIVGRRAAARPPSAGTPARSGLARPGRTRAGVDFAGEADLAELIGEIRARRGCGVLMISHDLHVVMAATDRIICLNRHVCCAARPTPLVGIPNMSSYSVDAPPRRSPSIRTTTITGMAIPAR